MEENNQEIREANYRLNVKTNAKGSVQIDMSARADDIETLAIRIEQLKDLIKKNGWTI